MKYACAFIALLVLTSGCLQLKEIKAGPEVPLEYSLPMTKYTDKKSDNLDFGGVKASYIEVRWERKINEACSGKNDVKVHAIYEDVYINSGTCGRGTCSKKERISKPVYGVDVEILCPSNVWVTVSRD
jgi:hypothetical protein